MELIGLRFFFGSGSFMSIVVTVDVAHRLIEKWMKGELIGNFKGDLNPPPGAWKWAISMDSVVAMHTHELPPEFQQAQARQQVQNMAYPGMPGKPIPDSLRCSGT